MDTDENGLRHFALGEHGGGEFFVAMRGALRALEAPRSSGGTRGRAARAPGAGAARSAAFTPLQRPNVAARPDLPGALHAEAA